MPIAKIYMSWLGFCIHISESLVLLEMHCREQNKHYKIQFYFTTMDSYHMVAGLLTIYAESEDSSSISHDEGDCYFQ
jgi:hypothetical protein